MTVPFAILFLPILASGCLGGGSEAGASAVPAPTPPSAHAAMQTALALAGCHQMHLAFTARPDDFAAEVPEGFTIKTDGPGGLTTTLGIVATRCESDAGTVAEALIVLPVEPPAALADSNTTHSLVIEGYASEGAHADRYAAWGLADEVVAAEVALAHGALLTFDSTALTVATDDHRYSLATTLNPSSGEFRGGVASAWIARDGVVLGRLVTQANASTNVGYGAVQFTYSGSGGAPPATAGIAHEVTGLALVRNWEAIE